MNKVSPQGNTGEPRYLNTTTLTNFYKTYINQKVILNMLLVLRIFNFLEISPLISFYLKIVKNFFKTFFNIYILIIICLFILTLIFFDRLAGNASILYQLLDTIIFSARALSAGLSSQPFKGTQESTAFICYAFSFIIKVFIFSIIFAAIKELYEFEIKDFQSYRENYHNKRLGDFIFFSLIFVLKNFYNIKEYQKLNQDHLEIINILKSSIPERKKPWTQFYELTEYEINDLAESLEKNNGKLNIDKYEIIKFHVRQKRDVYLISKRK